MSLMEPQEKELQAALRVTRLITLAICLGGPVLYILVYGMVVLKGQWALFLQGFDQVPWRTPLVLVLLALSATTLAGAFRLPRTLATGQPQKRLPALLALRTGSIIACALVEAVAIYGLVLGFVLGPTVAPLSLALMLVPPCYCLLNLPQEGTWRAFYEHHGMDSHD